MADNIKYRFIQNVGDYFPSGYFSEDFINKVQKTAGLSADEMADLCKPYVKLRGVYESYKNYILNTNPRVKDVIRHTHDFHTELLKILGYDTDNAYSQFVTINEDDHSVVPVRHIITKNGQPTMFVMEMQPLIKTGDQEPQGLFEQQYNVVQNGQHVTEKVRHQRYYAGQWSEVFKLPDDRETHISPAVINKAIDALFLLPEERRPHFILMLAGNTIFLLDSDKWNRNSYLQFSLDELFSQGSIRAFRNYYALFHLLVCKSTLSPVSDTVLMDKITEDSYRNAYEVTKDLKEGVILVVETLANEALWYWQHEQNNPESTLKDNPIDKIDYTDDDFETAVRDDCIIIAYRLLFIFFAESRDELGILPMQDDVYREGYSLDMLRDLEKVPLISDESRNGYFFHETLSDLFYMLSHGWRMGQQDNKSFSVLRIDSPLFDNKRLHYLGNVKIRNIEWQKIICALSLSNCDKQVGRISYANLKINQLGSVYESLLAYRGFYAEQDYIEVYKAGKLENGTYLVPYSRMDVFDDDEILKDVNGEVEVLKKGTFVYRLNGRDRQKSASYYTPEQLTKSTVKYTLKIILGDIAAGKRSALELLELKFLEPAMGAAAFQNEYINQVSYAYLIYRQEELRKEGRKNWRIQPEHWDEELQKVKAYIATHNVYGVDLNPTAIELGKLSLWLNVLHRDMETPFFSNRLVVGNAVIGAWFKVYKKEDVVGKAGSKGKLLPNAWWEKAPQKVHFRKTTVARSVNEIYHFLLPDKGMLAVQQLKDVYIPADATDEERVKAKERRQQLIRGMKNTIKEWTAPISSEEFKILQRLSAKIDKLLYECFKFQLSIEKYTNNKAELFGVFGQTEIQDKAGNYAEKERLNDTRYRHDSAYFRLKMVMDYWCSLWFWDFDHAEEIPTRKEYWSDIDAMLNVSDEEIEKGKRNAVRTYIDGKGQIGLFPEGHSNDIFYQQRLDAFAHEDGPSAIQEEEVSQVISKATLDTLSKTKGQERSIFDNSERFKYVDKLSKQYRFFHPMLEFIEVFWLRDGFDIICGNPPWVKWLFNAQNIIGEMYPEVLIKDGVDADEVMRNKDTYLQNTQLRLFYNSAETEYICTKALINSTVCYANLKGCQSDLFKCILANCLGMQNSNGYMGMVHPNTIFEEPKGTKLRTYIYHRLIKRFQFTNRYPLFNGVHGEMVFNVCIYRGTEGNINFDSISNLYTPNTIDSSYTYNENGICYGPEYVDNEGNKYPNDKGHKERIVHYDAEMLKFTAKVFEDTDDWEGCKLTKIFSSRSIDVLKKLYNKGHLSIVNPYITECLHATMQLKDNTMIKKCCYPNYDEYQMIFNSEQVNLLSPYFKMPRANGSKFDLVDYMKLGLSDHCRTLLIPNKPINEFKDFIDGSGKWFLSYKMGFKKMMDITHERTLKGALLPPKSSHTHSIISVEFKSDKDLLNFAGLCSAIPLDFFIKTVGIRNLVKSAIVGLPYVKDERLLDAIIIRVLRLNCINEWYKDLWEKNYKSSFSNESWSIQSACLSPYSSLSEKYDKNVLLRNDFERRQAFVELDVLSTMALGLDLNDLIFMYVNMFNTTQKYEADTWFDNKGRIVFTVNSGNPYDCERQEWEQKRGTISHDGKSYDGNNSTFTHEIPVSKSELYGGQTITFYPPYTRCDRIADYRRAWEFFEKKFNG